MSATPPPARPLRALVLGARGAVGQTVVATLRRRGHTVSAAGRAGVTGPVVDLHAPGAYDDLARLMREHDVLVNASGVEDPRLARVAGPGAAVVDISATSAYLDALGRAAPAGARVVLGAGLAPGLSTLLLASLDSKPGDTLDLGVLLGTGERHGAAAVEWTAGLVGTALHAPPEGGVVRNLRGRRSLPGPRGRRTYLRADFPDHVLLRDRDLHVHSHLAVGSRAATASLGVLARVPAARGLLARTPHVGSDAWHLVALNRRTGEQAEACGRNQSRATGVLTALVAERALDGPAGVVVVPEVVGLEEARAVLAAA